MDETTTQHVRIIVTGDDGTDYCMLDDETGAMPSEAGRFSGSETLLTVPAGARFAEIAIRTLLAETDGPQYTVQLSPCDGSASGASIQTFAPSIVTLDRYSRSAARNSERTIVRVRKVSRTLATPTGFVASETDRRDSGKYVVIHDRAGLWRTLNETSYLPFGRLYVDLLKRHFAQPTAVAHRPSVFVDLSVAPPTTELVRCESSKSHDSVWGTLLEHRDRVCVLCSARMLRHAGVHIGRHISWESALEDICSEFEASAHLRELGKFAHVIIRFGLNGVVHAHNESLSGGTPQKFSLCFGPNTTDLMYRDRTEHGDIVGENITLATSIIQALELAPSSENVRATISEGLQLGLRGCHAMFDDGYSMPLSSDEANQLIVKSFDSARASIATARKSRSNQSDEHATVAVEVDAARLVASREKARNGELGRFEILQDCIEGRVGPPGTKNREPVSRINLGLAVARFGPERVLNIADIGAITGNASSEHQSSQARSLRELLSRPIYKHNRTGEAAGPDDLAILGDDEQLVELPDLRDVPCTEQGKFGPVFAPILKYGKLRVIDRAESESVRIIRNLMKSYLEELRYQKSFRKPLSIAIFGPPGSGKSFAIGQIIDSVNSAVQSHSQKLELVESNVAQYRSVDDLEGVWAQASNRNNDGATPVVFLDEFDCAGQSGSPLAWLKYFLGPMNDGVFHGPRQPVRFGPAVLVFAGGLFHTFQEFFALRQESGTARRVCASGVRHAANVLRQSVSHEQFVQQKGPDFISRLHHHLNVASINSTPHGMKPVIRRAILIRDVLNRRGLMISRDGRKEANIDIDILYSLLTVDRYRHEIRSLENLLAMCRPINGRIEKASLPPIEQLEMHVDASRFMARIYRSRRLDELAAHEQVRVGKPMSTAADGSASGDGASTNATDPNAQFGRSASAGRASGADNPIRRTHKKAR